MPASFFYTNAFGEENKITRLAYKIIMTFQLPDYGRFFNMPPLPAGPPHGGYLKKVLRLADSAALMCGTTKELLQAIHAMHTWMQGFDTVNDALSIHFARIENSVFRPTTRTLLSIAPMRQWWKADNMQEAGTNACFSRMTPVSQQHFRNYRQDIIWKSLTIDGRLRGVSLYDMRLFILAADVQDPGAAMLRISDPSPDNYQLGSPRPRPEAFG